MNAKKLRSQGKRVLILLDMSDVQHHDSGSRQASMEFLRELSFDKMAFFGASLFLRNVVGFILKALRLEDRVKSFDGEKQALKWLTA